MLFTYKPNLECKELKEVNEIVTETINTTELHEDIKVISAVDKYLTYLVSSQYKKSIEDIENTEVSNKRRRKRSLQQAMQESFFNGANRFGNNFIA